MSDDETRPLDPEAPVPPPAPQAEERAEEQAGQPADQPPGQPAYAMPLPAGYPTYPVPQAPPRPRFADQVMGMRAVVATSLACLIVGGLGGFALGHATGGDDRLNHRFGHGQGFFQQRGGGNPFGPGTNQPGDPSQRFGQGSSQGPSQGTR